MKPIFYHYDIYPKVFLGDREQRITIQPLGLHAEFVQEKNYTVRIYKVSESNPSVYPERSGRSELVAEPDCDGCLRFSAHFEGEEFTEDELREIENFVRFVKSRRNS